jgi:hypothetical protein
MEPQRGLWGEGLERFNTLGKVMFMSKNVDYFKRTNAIKNRIYDINPFLSTIINNGLLKNVEGIHSIEVSTNWRKITIEISNDEFWNHKGLFETSAVIKIMLACKSMGL